MSKLANQNWYFLDSSLSREDQAWISENMSTKKYEEEEEEEETYIEDNTDNKTSDSVTLIRSVSGTYNHKDNFEQNQDKRQAISRLKQLNYRTPAKEISSCLNIIFELWEKKPEHWQYISQNYTPKTINSVIAQMTKEHQRGDKTFQTPGAYFTSVIKYRPKRKKMRATNGTYKQRGQE